MLETEMMSARWVVTYFLIYAALLGAWGCKREPGAAPPPHPTEEALPSRSEALIDRQTIGLPNGQLVVRKQDSALNAQLYSPEAAASYFFDMQLDAEEMNQLDHASWTFKTDSRERAEPANALMIESGQRQYQPVDVRAIVITIKGDFAEFIEEEDKPRRIVPMRIVIVATKEVQ